MADVPLPGDPTSDSVTLTDSSTTLPVDLSGQSLPQQEVGPVETDNYSDGGTFEANDSYPLTVNPGATVHELVVVQVGNDIVLDVTTTQGNTLTGINLDGSSAVIDTLAISEFEFRDPSATNQSAAGFWVGEPHE
jgi:Flp pilus assembly protein TadG